MASLYRRGKVWWSKSYEAGKMVRASLGTRDKTEARRRLREREAQMVRGERPTASKATWEDTAADLLAYYRAYGSRDPVEAERRLKHLDRYFKGHRLAEIDAAAVTAYVVKRREQGAAAASVNVELATLHKALKMAQENGKLAVVPTIRMLKPAAPRSGFLERHEVEAICSHLPDDLCLVVMIGYTFGWRINSEVLTLTKRQADPDAGTLRLEPGTTKNDDGRIVYLTPELKAGLIDQLAKVRVLERDMSCVIPYLFPHFTGMYRGKRRLGMREVWQRACENAGLTGKLKHDLRRSAVREMVNVGISDRVAMLITGHRTRAVFERYHIVGPQDLQEASRKLAEHSSDNRHIIQAQEGV